MGCSNYHQQHQPERIHQQVTLAPAQFLGSIITACAPLFTGSHRLAVHDRAAGLALSSGCLPHPFAHGVMDLLPDPLATPRPKVMVDRTPRGEIVRQQFPCAATTNRVTDPIHNLAPRVFWRTSAGFGCGHERFQAIPFGISEISIVGSTVFHVDRLRDRPFQTRSEKPSTAARTIRSADCAAAAADGSNKSESAITCFTGRKPDLQLPARK